MSEYPYVDEEKGIVYFNENMIVEQFVEVKWHGNNKKHYISHGYIYTKHGDIFTVDVRDLTKGSHIRVVDLCSICNMERDIVFKNIIQVGHTKCFGCAKMLDLTGLVFTRLTVIESAGRDKWGGMLWLCRCTCGNMKVIHGGSLQAGSTRSCGCLRDETARNQCGDKHGNWNPDISDEERDSFRSNDIKLWAIDVKKRDDFTCQSCGERGVQLASHHLNNYKDFPEQRTDLDNGVTLCEDCHKGFHSWMGNNRISCTSDDFVRFCKVVYPNALFVNR